ncbi:hypothetical protein Dimus_015012 [Dionaea muscipula]
MIQRTRFLAIQPHPRLPLATPMQQAHRPRVQRSTAPLHIVPSQTVLVPPVVDRLHLTSEHQQEWRQRPQLVDPPLLLDLHPILDLPPVIPFPPPHHVHHHHPRVEVAWAPAQEHPGQCRVGPERLGEVIGEVCVAVLRRTDDVVSGKSHVPELVHVVYQDQVRVQVDDPLHTRVEDVAQVVSGVVQRVLQRLADGGRD